MHGEYRTYQESASGKRELTRRKWERKIMQVAERGSRNANKIIVKQTYAHCANCQGQKMKEKKEVERDSNIYQSQTLHPIPPSQLALFLRLSNPIPVLLPPPHPPTPPPPLPRSPTPTPTAPAPFAFNTRSFGLTT